MEYVRSSAIMPAPKMEFEQWLLSAEIIKHLSAAARKELESVNLAGMRINSTIIATPPIQSDIESELTAFMKKNPDKILEAEFDRRGLSMTLKPQVPTLELLNKWFDISYHQFVFSLEGKVKR